MIKQRYVAPVALTALAAGTIVRRARTRSHSAPHRRRVPRSTFGRRLHT